MSLTFKRKVARSIALTQITPVNKPVPLREFDLALFFGLTGSDEGLDPPPVDSSTPNPPHASLPGLNAAPIGSAHEVESDEDDSFW